MENTQNTNNKPFDLIAELKWFFASFILMLASSKFYKSAAKKPARIAVLSFMLFMLVLSGLSTIKTIFLFGDMKTSIEQSYQNGTIPVITITDGIAESSGPTTFTYLDQEGMLVQVDVSGNRTEIDRVKYYQGFLLTQTDLHILNDDQYEVLPLIDLHEAFEENPIVIDEESIGELFNIFSSIGIISFILLSVFWNCFVRFLYMVSLGLVLWGSLSLVKKEISFNAILVLGSYSYMAALLYIFVAEQIGVTFFLLHTILMLAIWILHIYLLPQLDTVDNSLTPQGLEEDEDPNLLLALGGIPFLVIAIFSYFQETDLFVIPLIVTFLLVVGGILVFEASQDVKLA